MAHNTDDNPTAKRPWFGPIPTGGDWNPAHGADPDVIDFHRYAAGEPEHIAVSSVDTLTRLNRIRWRRTSPSPTAPHQLPAAHLSLRVPPHPSVPSDSPRCAAERGSAIPTPPTTIHTRTAYTPNRRHDSASSATHPPTRPRQSRRMLSAMSPAPRRQSGSAHRTAPGRYANLRSLSRPLPLRS